MWPSRWKPASVGASSRESALQGSGVLRWSSERADTAFSWTTGQLHLQEAKRQDLTVSLHSPQALECLINMQGEVIPREREGGPPRQSGRGCLPGALAPTVCACAPAGWQSQKAMGQRATAAVPDAHCSAA